MLGFHPTLYIDQDWTVLTDKVKNVAEQLVHTQSFKDSLLYEQGASQVASLPGGGWISKSGPSYDFFVMGGIPETEILDQKFQSAFPNFKFSPATICWSSRDIPKHADHAKNGKCSLVYPLHDSDSQGIVYDPDEVSDFTYGFIQYQPIMINITIPHMVKITEPRIWFSVHTHEPIDVVKNEFDQRGHIII